MKFRDCVNTLLKSEISEAELRKCECDLLQFVGECEILYGKEVMTFNLHSMLHLCESVRQSGPLWASSTFPFENGIFYFKRHINAPHGVNHQIANLVLKKQFIKSNINDASTVPACRNYCHNLFKPNRLINCVKSDNGVTLIGTGRHDKKIQTVMMNHLDGVQIPVKVFNRCIYKEIVLRSTSYIRLQKTDDTVVQIKSKKIIKIHSFVLVNNTCYLYGREMLITPWMFKGRVQLDHLFEVQDTEGDVLIVNAENVQCKVIHFSTGIKDYIAFFPKNLGM
ncbi:uncharacterized protein LOC112464375 [Temnothorax curvispinosus]|uniref:Uncharacterized protein LOC112464375 n=1 Tax=Temnothorax curvispinosus TaxID=300111 RepID=A0A6J1QWM7_9HYME|nr:uncharacterized protein LOC112464375 [Temnothorax curvispinosus]